MQRFTPSTIYNDADRHAGFSRRGAGKKNLSVV
jgi:hypothetical protein